jgi:hypothetical protein
MSAPPQSGIQSVCTHWLNAAATLLACQWKLFEAQYQAGLSIVEAALGVAGQGAGAGPGGAGELERLERLAAERASQGLAPPPEVYRAPYRGRIDWGRFPEWARPSDPELFEGTAHEG